MFKSNQLSLQKAQSIVRETITDGSLIILVGGPLNTFLDILLSGFDTALMRSDNGKLLRTIIAATEFFLFSLLIMYQQLQKTPQKRQATAIRAFIKEQAAPAIDAAATSSIALISLAGSIALASEAKDASALDQPVDIPGWSAIAICSTTFTLALAYIGYCINKGMHELPKEGSHSALYNKVHEFSHRFETATMITASVEFIERLYPNRDTPLQDRMMIAKAALLVGITGTALLPEKTEHWISHQVDAIQEKLGIKNLTDKLSSDMFYVALFLIAESAYFVYSTPITLGIRLCSVFATLLMLTSTHLKLTCYDTEKQETTPLLSDP